MFGQNPGGTFGSSAFGAAATQSSLFGGQNKPLFGQTTQPQSTGLFGQPAQTRSLFGTTNTPTATQPTTTSLFGQSTATTKPSLFGTTTQFTLGATQPQATSLFGATQPTATTGTSLFGATAQPTQTTSLFGAAATQQAGTPMKFEPVIGMDTMMKNGAQQSTQTKHQCVTAMEAYKLKSLEELRCEDYILNRKGPQQGGLTAFGQQPTATASALFGSTTATTTASLFGQQQQPQKSLFGTATTSTGLFGQSAVQPATSGLFGGGTSTFGAATSTAGSLFAPKPTQPTSLFGGTQTSVFGQQQPQQQATFTLGGANQAGGGLFGATSAAAKPSLFGATTTTATTGGLFGSTAATAPFGTTPASSTAAGGLFSTAKPAASPFGTAFGQTTAAPAFGATQTGGLFGQASTAKPGGLFGATTTQAPTGGLFGSTQPATGGLSLFGSTAQKPAFPGFGTSAGQTTAPFGTLTTSLAGAPSLFQTATATQQPAVQLGTTPAAATLQEQMLQATLAGMARSPYGDSPLTKLLKSETDDAGTQRATDPIAQQQILNKWSASPSVLPTPCVRSSVWSPESSLLNRSLGSAISIRPRQPPRLSGLPASPLVSLLSRTNQQSNMTRQLDEIFDDSRLLKEGFVPKRSVKTLILKSKSGSSASSTGTPSGDDGRRNVSTTLNPEDVDSPVFEPRRPRQPVISTRNSITNAQSAANVNGETNGESENVRARLNLDDSSMTATSVDTPAQKPSVPAARVNESVLDESLIGVGSTRQNRQSAPPSASSSSVESREQCNQIQSNGVAAEFVLESQCSAVRLTRSEYYTEPTLDQLAAKTDANGDCVISDGFTIGRTGYGSVFWPGSMNLANLNLDEVVVFRHKEITVYPDETKKPPVGEQLNRPAEVTLERVWPNDKQTRLPIKDPERLKKIGYRERLERASAEMGAAFRDYRPDTGSWVFSVPHFSKYGLAADDEDDDAMELTVPVQQQFAADERVQSAVQRAAVPRSPPKTHETSAVSQHSSSVKVVGVGLGGQDPPPIDECLVAMVDGAPNDEMMLTTLDGTKLQLDDAVRRTSNLMREQLYETYENTADVMLSQSQVLLSRTPVVTADDTLRELFETSRQLADTKPDRSAAGRTSKKAPKPESSREARPPLYPLVQTDALKSLMTNREHLHIDAALLAGRRCRASFSADHAVVVPRGSGCTIRSHTSRASVMANRLDKVAIMKHPFIVDIASNIVQMPVLRDFVRKQLAHSNIVRVDAKSRCPKFEPIATTADTLHGYRSLANELDVPDLEKSIWNLAVALWGDLEYNTSPCNEYQKQQRRKHAVSTWLTNLFDAEMKEELKSLSPQQPPSARLLIYVKHGRWMQAVQYALDNSMPRLAQLVACLGQSRKAANGQLARWTLFGCAGGTAVDDATYELMVLAGASLTATPAKGHELHCCDGLHWLRAFALHLWFVCDATCDLSDAIDAFDRSWRSFSETRCAPPLAPGESRRPDEDKIDDSHNFDMRYQLLKLYADRSTSMARVLNALGFGPNACDVHISWHVHCALRSLGYTSLPHDCADRLHLAYAGQLTTDRQQQCIDEALFVLLHIEDDHLRSTCVRDLINRCAATDRLKPGDDRWRLITEQLGVPDSWLFDAKRMFAVSRHEPLGAFEHAVNAELWDDAHTLFVQHVAPTLIINEDLERLRKELQSLDENSAAITNWAVGGQLFVEYVNIVDELHDGPSDELPDTRTQYFTDLKQRLRSLTHRIGCMACATPLQRLARSEMSKRTSDLTRHVFSVEERSSLGQALCRLPVEQDYAIQQMHDVAMDAVANML